MGITSNDIAAQRAMLKRGEEKRKAAKQAEERERLRDTFAAAALTGLMQFRIDAATPGAYVKSTAAIAANAYDIADAVLRERLRTLATQATPSEGSVPGEGTKPVPHQTCPHVRGTVTQHCSLNFTLTDAEREAVAYYVGTGGPDAIDATLRGLLKRLHT
jgi:hypothetical protein